MQCSIRPMACDKIFNTIINSRECRNINAATPADISSYTCHAQHQTPSKQILIIRLYFNNLLPNCKRWLLHNKCTVAASVFFVHVNVCVCAICNCCRTTYKSHECLVFSQPSIYVGAIWQHCACRIFMCDVVGSASTILLMKI